MEHTARESTERMLPQPDKVTEGPLNTLNVEMRGRVHSRWACPPSRDPSRKVEEELAE